MSRVAFNLYLVCNMALCQILFFPWAKPRETISGFVGRHAMTGCRIASLAARWIDKTHPWEPDHCRVTARQERECRAILYAQREDRI